MANKLTPALYYKKNIQPALDSFVLENWLPTVVSSFGLLDVMSEFKLHIKIT